MSRALNPWDPQSERIWTSDGAWHSLSANTGGGQSRDCVLLARNLPAAEAQDGRKLLAGHEGWGRIYCLQGNGIDRQEKNGCAGRGWREDVSYTINTIDRPAVCYAVHENDRQEVRLSEEKAYSLTVGGGKPGQGYPCVLLCPERELLRDLPANENERDARNGVPLRLRRGRGADRREEKG